MGFSQGISGLNAASSGLGTIGNNIANAQTKGFKTGRTEFADLYAGARTGLGVEVSGITQNFNNGSLETTGRNLDLAIDGKGFFRLQDGNQTVYSRNGELQQTKDGTIVNGQGAQLTGYNVSGLNSPGGVPKIDNGGAPQVIQLPAEGLSARATTNASLQADLDAGSPIMSGAFSAEDSNSYSWSQPNTVYDSLGNARNVNLYFGKTGENQWRVNGEMPLGSETTLPQTVDGNATYPTGFDPAANGNGRTEFTANGHNYVATVSGAISDDGGTTYSGGQIRYAEQLPESELAFDANGNLTEANPTGGGKPDGLADSAVNFSLDPVNGSAPIDFTFDFADSSQTAQKFAAGNPQQDGYASGDLSAVQIGDDGMIRGTYSNGQAIDLAQVSLASFRNEQGLSPVGGNAWVATAESGQPAIGTSGSGGLGDLRGGTLEGSNVELSEQLVNLIVMQRNYQANAQTIKTQNDVLQTAVNLR